MAKVSLDSNSVAYFDSPDLVDEPGFYIVDKEPDENPEIQVGKRVYPSPDGDGFVSTLPKEEEGGEN